MALEEDRVQLEHRLTKVEEAVTVLPSMLETMEAINTKFARYEGRWGTITLIGAALWAMLLTFKDDLRNMIRN